MLSEEAEGGAGGLANAPMLTTDPQLQSAISEGRREQPLEVKGVIAMPLQIALSLHTTYLGFCCEQNTVPVCSKEISKQGLVASPFHYIPNSCTAAVSCLQVDLR